MVFSQASNQTTGTVQEEGTKTLEDSLYSKYEPLIVSIGVILVAAVIFVLIKTRMKGFLTKGREEK